MAWDGLKGFPRQDGRVRFCAGISWENIWSQDGPAFVSRTDAGEDDLSWFMQSLALSQPLKVEYDS